MDGMTSKCWLTLENLLFCHVRKYLDDRYTSWRHRYRKNRINREKTGNQEIELLRQSSDFHFYFLLISQNSIGFLLPLLWTQHLVLSSLFHLYFLAIRKWKIMKITKKWHRRRRGLTADSRSISSWQLRNNRETSGTNMWSRIVTWRMNC